MSQSAFHAAAFACAACLHMLAHKAEAFLPWVQPAAGGMVRKTLFVVTAF